MWVLGATVALSGCCHRGPEKAQRDSARGEAGSGAAPGGDAGGEASVDAGADAGAKKKPKKRKKTSKKKKLPKPKKAAVDGPASGEGDCGSVEVDGVEVPLDCVVEHPDPLGLEGVDVVARLAIDGDATMAGGLPLPDAVDHRETETEGPVRQQGKAGSCTANALAAAIDHAILRRDGEARPVSALHLWARYHRPLASHADRNIGRLLASEQDFPYDQKLACMWVSSKTCKGCTINKEHIPCKQPVDNALVAAADSKPYARVLHVTRVDSPTTLQMRKILARGQDVWMGMKINRAAFKQASEGEHVVGDYDASVPVSGHSMLIAGYRTQPEGTYFLLHNSWGTKWGDGGYGWIHERQLADVKMIRVVEAVKHGEPLPPGESDAVAPPAGCTGEQVPDAASHACVARCPDGSPPLAGGCPSDEGCEPGEVALAGRCVASAPKRQGVARVNDVRFTCAPGGCVYAIPKGKFGCKTDSCAFSCAAPAFLLASGAQGVFCTE